MTTTIHTDQGPDVHERMVVHRAFRRESAAAAGYIRATPRRGHPPRRRRQTPAPVLNKHLDHEVRVVLPLILEHDSLEMVERDRHKAMAEIGRKRVAQVLGWVLSCLGDEQLESFLAEQPRVVRFLCRRFWWPACQRRVRTLYGRSVHPCHAPAGSAAA